MKTLTVVAALVMLAGAAHAQETPWSVGLSFASARENFDDDGFSFDDGTALALRAEYRMNPMFTFQGELEYVDGFDGDLTLGPTTANAEIEAWVLAGKVKYFPLSKTLSRSFQPYLLGGIGVARSKLKAELVGFGSTSENGTDFVWTAGFGFDYWATERWTVGAEWAIKDIDGGEGYSTIGVNFRRRF